MFIQLSSGSPMLVSMCRPRKRETTIDLAYVQGLAQTIPIQWSATDPTLYAAGTLNPSVGVPAPLGGFTFNLSFNLSFGGGVEYGAITATNYGDLPCYPIIASRALHVSYLDERVDHYHTVHSVCVVVERGGHFRGEHGPEVSERRFICGGF